MNSTINSMNSTINYSTINSMNSTIDSTINSMDISNPSFDSDLSGWTIALGCPVATKYKGDTLTLQATPRDGTYPYNVEFRKNGIAIPGNDPSGNPYTITGALEDVTLTRTYVITNDDVRLSSGSIDFSVYISDSCPTGSLSCSEICTVTLGCLTPVCNFTVT
jgi:hypothetical protein